MSPNRRLSVLEKIFASVLLGLLLGITIGYGFCRVPFSCGGTGGPIIIDDFGPEPTLKTNPMPAVTPVPTPAPLKNSTTMLVVYICNNLLDPMQSRKIEDLHSIFDDKLLVVTDQQPTPQHLPSAPHTRVIDKSDQAVTSEHLYNHLCCGLERAMMWLIRNQHEYDHAWVIEEDVFWTDVMEFKAFLQSYDGDETDLLHQNSGMEQEPIHDPNFWNFYHLQPPKVRRSASLSPPFYKGLFSFYRMSSRFAARLEAWRLSNHGEWTFFEPLLGTLAVRDKTLQTASYIDNNLDYPIHLTYRPCFQEKTIRELYGWRGLFHPVKKGFMVCE